LKSSTHAKILVCITESPHEKTSFAGRRAHGLELPAIGEQDRLQYLIVNHYQL
jgi:hypothetical protein